MFCCVFWCSRGGDGSALFQLWGAFSAEAGTIDFYRQYNVLAVFSRFGGFQKHDKSDKKVLENLLFFALRKKRSGIGFFIFLGFLLDSISSPGLKKWSWILTLFLKYVVGGRRERSGVVLGCFWNAFWGLLEVSLAPLSNKW